MNTMNWIKTTEQLPQKDGEYLVVKSIMGVYNKIDVCKFTLNLRKLNNHSLVRYRNRPGWYKYDNEVGYYEESGITHWTDLPELPND